jgi:hypothetical protein
VTEPRDYDQDDAVLPGLEPPRSGAGSNERAARRTLTALARLELVGEREAVIMEGLLTAARQIDRAAASGKAKEYGVAELLGQLRELYRVLVPETTDGGERSAWDEFLDELAGGGGSTAPVRDAP